MTQTIGWWDRLRIERLVWLLDQQLYDLPRRMRIDTRREVRANLVDAARDVRTTEALRRLGGSRQLAERYLVAELGEGPRHSWIVAFAVLGLLPLLLNYFYGEVIFAFQAGVLAADPQATGTFTWHGMSYLQGPITLTITDGQALHSGGGWTPLAVTLWLGATVASGRLWRLFTSGRRDLPSRERTDRA